jgi:hypothetical protein
MPSSTLDTEIVIERPPEIVKPALWTGLATLFGTPSLPHCRC